MSQSIKNTYHFITVHQKIYFTPRRFNVSLFKPTTNPAETSYLKKKSSFIHLKKQDATNDTPQSSLENFPSRVISLNCPGSTYVSPCAILAVTCPRFDRALSTPNRVLHPPFPIILAGVISYGFEARHSCRWPRPGPSWRTNYRRVCVEYQVPLDEDEAVKGNWHVAALIWRKMRNFLCEIRGVRTEKCSRSNCHAIHYHSRWIHEGEARWQRNRVNGQWIEPFYAKSLCSLLRECLLQSFWYFLRRGKAEIQCISEFRRSIQLLVLTI